METNPPLGEHFARHDVVGKAPRSLRFAFSPQTTSSLPLHLILNEIKGLLEACSNQLRFEHHDYTFQVESVSGDLRFEIEVCTLPGISQMKALRFQRIAGDTWHYKSWTQTLLQHLRL